MDRAGVAITDAVFPLLPIQKHLFDEPRWKTKLQKAMKPWQGPRNIKWKKNWVPNWPRVALGGESRLMSWAQIPSGALEESVIGEIIARPRLNLRKVNVSRLNWSKTTLWVWGSFILHWQLCMPPPWRRITQPMKISAHGSSPALTHTPTALTTADRTFIMLGKRE